MTVTAPRDILDCMTSPEWFGKLFGGDEWEPWRTFVAACFGLTLPEGGSDLFQQCTGLPEPSTERSREIWAIVGRRGGKSRIAAFVAMYGGWKARLDAGERGVIFVMAVNRTQAAVVFDYLRALFEHPSLAELVSNETAETIELGRLQVVIQVASSSFRSTRGRTLVACVIDEVAFLYDSEAESALSAEELIRALRPGMLTMPGSMLLAVSSPYGKRGPLYDTWKRHFGVPGSTLVWRAPTLVMHPSLSRDDYVMGKIAEEREADPQAAASEYDAEWRVGVAAFLDRELLQSLVIPGLKVREPLPGITYIAFVDAAAGGADSYCAAIGHVDGRGTTWIDNLIEYPPGASPDAAAGIVDVLRTYRVDGVTGDNFAKLWTQEAYTSRGVRYDRCPEVRSDVYLASAAAFLSGNVRLLDHPRSISQLANLERRTQRGGKETVGHPLGTHDDLANCIAGVVYLATVGKPIPGLWDIRKMLRPDGTAVHIPGLDGPLWQH